MLLELLSWSSHREVMPTFSEIAMLSVPGVVLAWPSLVWPEDLIEWFNVTVGIKALGANLANIPKSDNCPATAIKL